MGISAIYHDSAAAPIRDGENVAATPEERFSCKEQDPDLQVTANSGSSHSVTGLETCLAGSR